MSMEVKGSANMWWIIVAAIISLIVLIVLVSIFTTESRKFNVGISDCTSKLGICVKTSQDCTSKSGTITNTFECSQKDISEGKALCCLTLE